MIKKCIIITALFFTSCTYNDMRRLFTDRPDSYAKLTDYSKNQNQNLKTQSFIHTKKELYRSSSNGITIYTGGSVYRNLDVFKKTFHDNGFAQVGVEY